MRSFTRPPLSRRHVSEAAAWITALGAVELTRALAPELWSTFAIGPEVMIGLALVDLATSVLWERYWPRRPACKLPALPARSVTEVLVDALIAGLVVSLARQAGIQRDDAVLWIGYGVQAVWLVLVVATGLWVWWNLRQRRRAQQ